MRRRIIEAPGMDIIDTHDTHEAPDQALTTTTNEATTVTTALINAAHALLLHPAVLVDQIDASSLRRPPRVAVDDLGQSSEVEECRREPSRSKRTDASSLTCSTEKPKC